MIDSLKKAWLNLQPRERSVLLMGGVFVCLVLFYQLLWAPWHTAIDYMEEALVNHRKNLVWMRQQSTLLTESGGVVAISKPRGTEDSLMSVIERSAGLTGVRGAIKQLTPQRNNTQVSVVLEGVSFNRWVTWVDSLQSNYGVSISQLSAEREGSKPDVAEIRVTFERE